MRVLIFKANQLGDNVVFLPIVQAFRRLFPQWELAVVTSPVAEPLYEAAIPDPAQRFIVSTARFNRSWRQPTEFLRHWWRATAFRPDACLLAEDQANVAYLLAFLCGSPRRIAMERPFIKVQALATRLLPPQADEKVPLVNWRIARALVQDACGEAWPAEPPSPDLSHLLSMEGPSEASRKCRIVIHPGASRAYQRWLPERYIELANRLAAKGNAEVVWIETTTARTTGLTTEVSSVRTPSVRELVQTLHGAALFVGNNSGPMHVANALGCPCVIINGPTSYHWDPVWHAERMLMLRDTGLPCLPCDALARPANVCQNTLDPMACMKFWSVDAIYERCLEWAQRWSQFSGQARTSSL